MLHRNSDILPSIENQLLRLEASKPLQDVLQRERKKAYKRAEQKGREALDAYREDALKKTVVIFRICDTINKSMSFRNQ